MIRSNKELHFYIKADRMMNRGCFSYSFKDKFCRLVAPDYIMNYLVALRNMEFYSLRGGVISKMLYGYYAYRHKMLGIKLGFSINENSLGYGVVIPHHGTIVVGDNKIGNYAVLHTCTCITGNGKTIGDGLYLATGAKITKKCTLGDGVTVAANAVVTSTFGSNILLAGVPAEKKRTSEAWYLSNGDVYFKRYQQIEQLKKEYGF